MADSPLLNIFDRATADMVRFAGQHRDKPEGAVADAMSRQFRVFTTALGQGGPDALKAILDNPQELQRRNIDPAFASGIKQFVDRHASATAVSTGMSDELTGVIRQEATAHVQRLQAAASPRAPHAAPPPPAPPPTVHAAPPPAAPPTASPPPASPPPSAGPQAHAQANNAGAAGGGAVPPASGSPDGHHNGGEHPKTQYKTTSRAGVVTKTIVALAAAAGLGWYVSNSFNEKAEKERATAGRLQPRSYGDVREMEAKDGPVRLFVDQALGAGGLSGYAGKQNGRELQAKTGFTPQQFFQLNQALRAQETKVDYYGKILKGQEAKTTFALNTQGKFEAIPAGKEADYANSLKVTVSLSKQEVGMTVDDPKSGKGPQTVTYPNSAAVQSNLILDPKERAAAYGTAWDAAASATEATKAAAAASSAEAAKKTTPRP